MLKVHLVYKLHNYRLEIFVAYLREFLLKSPVVFSLIEFGRLDT